MANPTICYVVETLSAFTVQGNVLAYQLGLGYCVHLEFQLVLSHLLPPDVNALDQEVNLAYIHVSGEEVCCVWLHGF